MELNFPKLEEKILKFWEKNKVFERSIKKRKKDFVFFEGPPTANAPPGLHHVLARVFKDIVCRYKTMRGQRVVRKAGWDTHGLPVEIQIEKKLGLKSKKEIERFGISKFNKECQKSVWEFKKSWEKLTQRIGFWLDLKNPYITYEPDYIESVWYVLKKIWEKGLLYQDFKVVPFCPRCGTPLSSHEVAQGYQRIKEPAIFVKFKILNPEFKDASLLIWTTTPWTLPANVAVAVNSNFDYCQLKIGDELLILAKERINTLNLKGEILKEFKGKDLVGTKYLPPFDFYQPNLEKERIWEVLAGDFVSLKEGTGLVHIAPAFGEEDLELIKKENEKREKKFPILVNVDEEGKFKLEVKKWAGIFVKEADPLIIKDLKERGLLFKEEIYEHDYPFCWRCKSPLLYYAKKSWFIKVTKVKEQLIKNNQKINWVPDFIGKGRFGEWLKEVKDWALSRERYWGTPLPIWQCKNCHHQLVIGGKEDLRKQKFSKNKYFILRHGESEMNKKGILISVLPEKIPCPLTEKGKEQILKTAKELKGKKIDLIIASDLLRTRQSAEILAKELGAKVIFDKRLRDIKAGVFEGKSQREHTEFWKNYEERYKKRPKGGENYNDVKMRIYNFLKEIDQKYQGKTILLVSHQRPLAMLEGALNGYSIKEFEKKIEPKKLKCGESREIEFRIFPYDEEGNLNFHRPFVDEIKFLCPKCQGNTERVPEVIDCWFDSGAMPFAQYHFPFENKKLILEKNQFPADYICEGIDQTRGWFYTLLAVSTLLGFGAPYKNVISLGHVLDEKGEKMSKSKGNVVDPFYIVGKYGADATRWYFFTINQPWEPKLFKEKDVEGALKNFILVFWNCYQFFKTYSPKKIKISLPKKLKNILDAWILSKFNSLLLKIIQALENYDITFAAREIEKFVVQDLSQWYVRRSRKRFQFPNEKETKEAIAVLGFLLFNLAKILAPFLPFVSEAVWQGIVGLNFRTKKSVHLEDWPKTNKKLINKKLEKEMEATREIVREALAKRQKAKIKVRQPLKSLTIKRRLKKDFLDLIKEEVNVKEVKIGKVFNLDTKITPELKKEGQLREIIRQIQQARKEANLKPTQKVKIYFEGDKKLLSLIKERESEILRQAKVEKVLFDKTKEKIYEKIIKVDEKEIKISIQKI